MQELVKKKRDDLLEIGKVSGIGWYNENIDKVLELYLQELELVYGKKQ